MLNKKSKKEKYNQLVEIHEINKFDSLLNIIKQTQRALEKILFLEALKNQIIN